MAAIQPMRLLAISSYGVLGGAELSLAEFLVRRPPDVEAQVLLIEDGPLREHLDRRGISTSVAATSVAGGYDGRPSPAQMIRFTRLLLRMLDRQTVDVVWANGLKAATMAVPACRLARIPLVWHKLDFSLDRVIARPLAIAVNGVVSVSEAVADSLGPGLRTRKLLAVVGVPIRLPEDLHIAPSESPPVIGTMATLTPIKGQRHIIEAAGLLVSEFPQLRVVLAGARSPDFPDYPMELEALASELGLDGRIELPGFVEDITEVLGRLTVFVNATCRDGHGFGLEGLGGSLLEASWVGLPVVATRGGGVPEALRDGVTGTLVDEHDPASIARAAARYLGDPQLARRTGEAGRSFARERFAPQVTADRLFQALAEAASASVRSERAIRSSTAR
jgi:glycosyltransferase involved in cell wall biosynthesis